MFDEPHGEKVIAPPNLREQLTKYLKGWAKTGGRSKHIPVDFIEAAAWWVDHQEPPDETLERATAQRNADREIIAWVTPYHDRVRYSLTQFLNLTEIQKAFVIDKIEHGLAYRGDRFEYYKKHCDQREAT